MVIIGEVLVRVRRGKKESRMPHGNNEIHLSIFDKYIMNNVRELYIHNVLAVFPSSKKITLDQ